MTSQKIKNIVADQVMKVQTQIYNGLDNTPLDSVSYRMFYAVVENATEEVRYSKALDQFSSMVSGIDFVPVYDGDYTRLYDQVKSFKESRE